MAILLGLDVMDLRAMAVVAAAITVASCAMSGANVQNTGLCAAIDV